MIPATDMFEKPRKAEFEVNNSRQTFQGFGGISSGSFNIFGKDVTMNDRTGRYPFLTSQNNSPPEGKLNFLNLFKCTTPGKYNFTQLRYLNVNHVNR